jgi:hypothetical protein
MRTSSPFTSVLDQLFINKRDAKNLLSEAKAKAKDDRKNHNLELEERIFGNGHPLSSDPRENIKTYSELKKKLPEDEPSTSQSALTKGVKEDLPSFSKSEVLSSTTRNPGPATQVYNFLDKLFPLNTPSNTPLPLSGKVGNDKPPQR